VYGALLHHPDVVALVDSGLLHHTPLTDLQVVSVWQFHASFEEHLNVGHVSFWHHAFPLLSLHHLAPADSQFSLSPHFHNDDEVQVGQASD